MLHSGYIGVWYQPQKLLENHEKYSVKFFFTVSDDHSHILYIRDFASNSLY